MFLYSVMKNVSSSTSHQNFKLIMSSIFIYEPILIKLSLKANTTKANVFIELCMSSKVMEGQIRSTACLKNHIN